MSSKSLVVRALRTLTGGDERGRHPASHDGWSDIFGSGLETPAGIDVTPETASASATVFACTRVLAEAVAVLPLLVYQRDGRNRDRARAHPLYRLLHLTPNPEMSSFTLRELMMKWLCLWGNGICEIDWGKDGYPRGLWPLPVNRVGIERLKSGQLYYWYSDPRDGRIGLPASSVLHFKFMGNGLWGESPVRVGARSLGLDLATEEFGSRYFANGARPGVVLKHPGLVSEKAKANLKSSWNSEHQGLSNAHRFRVLEEGMDIATIGHPPEEAQFLETRRFQRAVVAAWFRVPLHKLNDYEGGASYASAHVMQRAFYDDTLVPWLERFEQEMMRSLLIESELDTYYIEHLADALLRADPKDRFASYQIGVQSGILSPNEARERENLNPYAGGDVHLLPLNMINANDGRRTASGATERRDGGATTRDDSEELTATGRRQLAAAYRRLFEDNIGRLSRREVADLRRAVEKHLIRAEDVEAWRAWLDDFYTELREAIPPYLAATLESLAAQVAADVAGERGENIDPDDLEDFRSGYLETFAGGYVASHARQLRILTDEAEQDGVDPVTGIGARLDSWEETEAERQAAGQAFEAVNALARAAYILAGVTVMRWMATGESCPFCQAMNGRTAGVEEFFVEAGGTIAAADGKTMTVVRAKRYGPLHEKCDCVVVAA